MKILSKGILASSFLLASQAYAADWYVSPTGDDSAAGSMAAPFKTLAKAGNTAVAGDTVYIREGTYEEVLRPANSGTETQPIVFTSYEGEKVVITAMEALSGWTLDTGAVYKTQVSWDLGQENFVMNGSTALDLARWPNNVDGNPFTLDSLRNTGGSGSDVGEGAFLEYAPGIPDIDWSKGGSLFFYGDKPGAGWLAWRAFIESNTDTRVTFDLSTKNPQWIRIWHDPESTGEFFLQGARGVLDYQNEWYFDPETKTLYVQLPEDAAPADGAVKMRKRVTTINLANRSFIEVRDLAVFGGSIEMTGNANNNRLYGVSSFYGNHTLGVTNGFAASSQSVHIRGDNNIVERSEIAFGTGTGIRDAGKGTQILNSYIHDFNTLGDYNAVILARDGSNTIVRGNTVNRAGRDIIQSVNKNSDFSYNDVSYSNLIADDCALFYTVGGPQNTSVHHNWFHDAYSSGSKKKAAGIYLDNDSEDFSVYNNVIWNTEWSAIQINWDGTDLDIFNNTMWNNDVVMGAWHLEGTAFSDVRVWNNLADGDEWEPQSDKQNNLTVESSPFVSLGRNDFRLKEGSSPIDYGREIAGLTNGFTGAAPDVGAYEFGGEIWVAGIAWEKAEGPAGLCYELPGESCGADATDPTVPEIPGAVQAEDYVDAFDTTAKNIGGKYRNDAVDIVATTDLYGGYAVGYIDHSEWLEYDIDVKEAGDYVIAARLASRSSGGYIRFYIDGKFVGEELAVPTTAAWDEYETVKVSIGGLTEGLHTLRASFVNGFFNLNWFEFEKEYVAPNTLDFAVLPPATILTTAEQSFDIEYYANESRDIYVSMFNTSWAWLASQKITVEPGAGSKTLSMMLNSVPVAGEKFIVKIESRPAGGAWNSPGVIQSAVTVTAEDAVEQVVNGTFKDGLNGWQPWGRAHWDNGARVQGAGAIGQVITGLQPNTLYKLSAEIKVNDGNFAFLGVKDHGFADTGVTSEATQFETVELEFKTGPEATSAQVYFYVPQEHFMGFVRNFSVIRQR